MGKMQPLIWLLAICLIACNSPEKGTEGQEILTDDKQEETTYNPDPAHYARVSLDYWGHYKGTIPCADCEGIKIAITLSKGDLFEIERQYLGKSETIFSERGSFEWDDTGNIIILKGISPPNKYFVSENRLFHLDEEGRKIRGALEEKYILNKTD